MATIPVTDKIDHQKLKNIDILYQPEHIQDDEQIEHMNAEAFGPGRFTRAAHLIREGGGHDLALSYVAKLADNVIASVRMTHIKMGACEGYLLGPIVVKPDFKNLGLGAHLMMMAIDGAKKQACPIILLVGDEPYYRRFGFIKIHDGQLKMPAPVNPQRLLALELQDKALETAIGDVNHFNCS